MIHAREYGTTGPWVHVLHGGPAAWGDVRGLARALGRDFRVVEPRQRGSGGERLTVARHVADLAELLAARRDDGPPPVLVGHSWGAMLALCFAAAHPDAVGGVAAVACGTFDATSRVALMARREARMDAALRARLAVSEADARVRFLRDVRLTRPFYHHDPDEDVEDDLDLESYDIPAFEETWEDMARLQADGTYPAAFSGIRVPVLMLHGVEDPHPGGLIRDSLRPHIPHLAYCALPHCGHYPWRERQARDVFLGALRPWLRKTTA